MQSMLPLGVIASHFPGRLFQQNLSAAHAYSVPVTMRSLRLLLYPIVDPRRHHALKAH